MKTLGRIALGALLGLAAAIAFLVCLIIATEYAYAHGFRYDDLTLAWLSFGLLLVAPIIGGWWGWVRS